MAVASAGSLAAQEPLSLEQAVRLALESNPQIDAAQAGEEQAEAGVLIARAGLYPRLSVSESYTRSNNPVFAFSSLLNQRRFAEPNFAIANLNHPGSFQNFSSAVRLEQTLFDAQRTKQAIRAARLERELSESQSRQAELGVVLGAVRTYLGALVAAEAVEVAEDAAESARADRRRAEALLEAGLATRADALSVEAHLSAVEEQRIRAENDARTALAALKDALGVDFAREFALTTPLTEPPAPAPLERYLALTVENRPDLRQSTLGKELAEAQRRQAQSALWPQVGAFGSVQADTQRFVDRGAGSWFAGAELRWDLWNGSENRARVRAARAAEERAAALERQALSAAGLEVRRYYGDLESAARRVEAAGAAVRQAEESLRIIRNRYEAGLENVTELLRSQTALTEASYRRLAALYDQRAARAALEHAAGVLDPNSEALR